MARIICTCLLSIAIVACDKQPPSSQVEIPAQESTVITNNTEDAIKPTSVASNPIEPSPRPIARVAEKTITRVLLVSFDGLRPDAINAEIAPTLQGLIDGGTYQPAALAEIPASTLPNHTSMVTGLSIASHGVVYNDVLPGRIDKPTVFDVVLEHGMTVGFFAGKTKLGYLCESSAATAWHIESNVDALADLCADSLRNQDLRFVFLHLRQPDGAGHAEGWMTEPYFAAVRETDAAFARVIAALDESGRRDETLIIVTADHGGHGKTHGFPIPDDQHVPFILNGPNIAIGRILTGTVRPMDAAATALDGLGLPTVIAKDGNVLVQARDDYLPPTPTSNPVLIFAFPCGPMPGVFILMTFAGIRRMRRRKARSTILA